MAAPLPPNPYKILGITIDAQLHEIRTAHRKLVLKCHPDKVEDPSLKAQKQDEFQKVQQAYELISDEARRSQYDDQVKLFELRRKMERGTKGQNGTNTSKSFGTPVTKATLSELDINQIVLTLRLRHDINFDPDLHFRPKLDGERGEKSPLENKVQTSPATPQTSYASPALPRGEFSRERPAPYPGFEATKHALPVESPVKKQSKWTVLEDALIIGLRGKGMKWEDISKRLPGRGAISCRLHYHNYLEQTDDWDEERKNNLVRLYERFKPEMMNEVAEEMAVPWRAAEAMHWQLGEGDMARRAGTVPFSNHSTGAQAVSTEQKGLWSLKDFFWKNNQTKTGPETPRRPSTVVPGISRPNPVRGTSREVKLNSDKRRSQPPEPVAPTEESPLYVNAKQFHRILKRRVARQKLEEELRLASKERKPYIHEIGHGKHATRRPGGAGGRFLTADEVTELERTKGGGEDSPSRRFRRGRGSRQVIGENGTDDPNDPDFFVRDIEFRSSNGSPNPAKCRLDSQCHGPLLVSEHWVRENKKLSDVSSDFHDPGVRSVSGHDLHISGILRNAVFNLKGSTVTFRRDIYVCKQLNTFADMIIGAEFMASQFAILFSKAKKMFAGIFSSRKEKPDEKARRQILQDDADHEAHKQEQKLRAKKEKKAREIQEARNREHEQQKREKTR